MNNDEYINQEEAASHAYYKNMRPNEKDVYIDYELEIKSRDMVIDYLYRIGSPMHPSQMLYWAHIAIKQGVDLENVNMM